MEIFSRIFSILFHPLLFPTYGAFLIIAANPNRFGYFGERFHGVWLIMVFSLTFLFPVVWMAMMKRLEMIESLALETKRERIIPLIASATFYLWAAWQFKPNANMKLPTNELVFFMLLGCALSIFILFFVNVFEKISLHAAGAGGLFGLTLVMVRISFYDLRLLVIAAILIAGLTGTARLILKAHTQREILTGYLAGFTGQFVAFSIVPRFL